MTKTIPFGELNLTTAQVNKMGKALWDNEPLPPEKWKNIGDRSREGFIREFVLTIPKTLSVIGLKVVAK